MNKKNLLKLAKEHRIADLARDPAEVIRSIQRAEGNFDCYASACSGECDQAACSWRSDCLPESRRRSAVAVGG